MSNKGTVIKDCSLFINLTESKIFWSGLFCIGASVTGAVPLFGVVTPSPPPPTKCDNTLEQLCGADKRTSPGDCEVCAGMHQKQLEIAGCNNPDIEQWCIS